MQAARPGEAGQGPGAELRSGRRSGAERPLLEELAEQKWQAGYWRSMHARAKERETQWQSRIKQLERELAAARERIEELESRAAELEQRNTGLEQRNKELLRSPFGKRSEKSSGGSDGGSDGGQGPPGTTASGTGTGEKRQRGGQPGAPAPARVKRSGLNLREELHEPPADSRCCADCGQPFSRNGEETSERIEIEVRGYTRRIRRPRFRAACACAQRQGKPVPAVIAPLEPALFRGSGYGLSVWVAFLVQVYWQRHPARAFEREWADCGVRIPVGTLLGHARDFLTWFEPLEQAIGARQEGAALVHGDETSWIVHVRAEDGRNPRCWLWACLSCDALRLRVDPSRSAAAAAQLFGRIGQERTAVLLCDRYAAYIKLVAEHRGQFVLALCRAHARRDFVTLGRVRPELQEWVDGIAGRIGMLYRFNAERLAQWDPQCALPEQCGEFQAAQARLEAEFAALFGQAGQDLQALEAAAGPQRDGDCPDPRAKPLKSLLKHRQGLAVFLAKPFVPMDNNPVERALRRPVVGRKLSYGSHSEDGAALQGVLLSVLATLDMAGINLWRWLEAFPGECARIGPRAVVAHPRSWLPRGMPAARLRQLQAGRGEQGPDP